MTFEELLQVLDFENEIHVFDKNGGLIFKGYLPIKVYEVTKNKTVTSIDVDSEVINIKLNMKNYQKLFDEKHIKEIKDALKEIGIKSFIYQQTSVRQNAWHNRVEDKREKFMAKNNHIPTLHVVIAKDYGEREGWADLYIFKSVREGNEVTQEEKLEIADYLKEKTGMDIDFSHPLVPRIHFRRETV